jgi:Uri superfamily endonuclease
LISGSVVIVIRVVRYMQKNSSKCFHIADYILAEKVSTVDMLCAPGYLLL